jgi:hypothetical protein
LNPKQQKKGGFAAFVERENERGKTEEARALAARPATTRIFDRPILVTEDQPRAAPTAQAERADKTAGQPAPTPKVARG